MDKQVSQEIDRDKATKTRAGNYHKNLLAGSGKLDEIVKLFQRRSHMALHPHATVGGQW